MLPRALGVIVLAGTLAVIAPREAGAGPGYRIFNVADTNADGLADLLWVDEPAHHLWIWLMNGTQVLAPGQEISGPPGEGWTAVTAADMNRDGMNDVIWTRPGRARVWLLQGTRLLAPGPEIQGPGEDWVVGNVGDTNGDGQADLVWHDAVHNRAEVWLMEGTRVLARGPEIPGPAGEGWVITNIADTSADGQADIVWTNPERGALRVWLLHGARLLAAGPEIAGPPGEGWSGVTAADTNRDGMSDVIWGNATRGTAAVWLMNGAQMLAPGPEIQGPPGEGWVDVYDGDTNADGMADTVWQQTGTSNFAVWLMNGAQVLAPGPVRAGPG